MTPSDRPTSAAVAAPGTAHHLRRIGAASVALALAAALLAWVVVERSGTGPNSTAKGVLSAALTTQPPSVTRVRVSTFNVLGYGHTDGKANWYDGRTRQKMANQIIRANNLEIVGFQEFEYPQIDVFTKEMGATYDLWPGMSYKGDYRVNVIGNSIGWRKDRWKAVERFFYKAPYFKGAMQDRPVVLLENLATGQRMYVLNTHNAAETFGPAQKWRDQAEKIQIDLVNRLRREHPSTPIVFTGDMNDRDLFYCPVTALTTLEAANGGYNKGGSSKGRLCQPPSRMGIDWIMGTPDIAFSGYQSVRTPYVKKTTDHPVVWADLTIPTYPVRKAGIKRVVVLDVSGLNSAALRHPSYAPHLTRLMQQGASTLNARTATERTTALPNLASMLTGRRVSATYAGHGVKATHDTKSTMAKAAGRYVPGAFDIVHNEGHSTALLSSDPDAAFIARSWNAANGHVDSQGRDFGRNKVSMWARDKNDGATLARLTTMLKGTPKALNVVQLSSLRLVGQQYGWGSRQYFAKLTVVDAKIGQALAALRANSRIASSTLVVVTSDSGGTGRTNTDTTSPTSFTVPFVVAGPGVPAGRDLYDLNPAWRDLPATARGVDSGAQPVRVSSVANLVTTVLGLPKVPGAQNNPAQDLNVFVAP